MDLSHLPDDASNDSPRLENQLYALNALTRTEFDAAETLIHAKLRAALDSLGQSARAIRMLMDGQSPAELASAAGIALRRDLEGLLASSTHLTRLAGMMEQGFAQGREACEGRTSQQVISVMEAISRHRTTVQDSAIALAEATLDRARGPSPMHQARRSAERRPR